MCKIADFGCSVAASSTSLPIDHSLVGTPGYQAPEFIRGSVPTPSCDIYSLGILFWQLDSRQIPYCGQHPQAVMFQVVSVGARPIPPPRTDACVNLELFTSLYKSCWNAIPHLRPIASTVVEKLSLLVGTNQKSSRRVSYLR